MAIYKTEAIVLERKDYRETSYLLRLFTSDFGQLNAQAKGAKRKIDKFGTNFLPISYNKIVFYDNERSDLHILSQADLLEHFDSISNSIEKFTYASYFLELVSAAMPLGQKNKEVFELVMCFLNVLNKKEEIKHITQIFEIKFLSLSGFKPRLDCCVSCDTHLLEKSRFSYVLGGLLCPTCFSVDPAARSVMQGTIASVNHIEKMDLEKMASFCMVASVKKELEQILRNFIDFHLGRQFKTLEFMKKVRHTYV